MRYITFLYLKWLKIYQQSKLRSWKKRPLWSRNLRFKLNIPALMAIIFKALCATEMLHTLLFERTHKIGVTFMLKERHANSTEKVLFWVELAWPISGKIQIQFHLCIQTTSFRAIKWSLNHFFLLILLMQFAKT